MISSTQTRNKRFTKLYPHHSKTMVHLGSIIRDLEGLTARDKATLYALATYANIHPQYSPKPCAFPTQKTLIRATGNKQTALTASLKELERKGFIQILKHARKTATVPTHVYILSLETIPSNEETIPSNGGRQSRLTGTNSNITIKNSNNPIVPLEGTEAEIPFELKNEQEEKPPPKAKTKPKKKGQEIPTLEKVTEHMLLKLPEINTEWTPNRIKKATKSRYETFLENDWKDGHNNPVKLWKSKFINAIKFEKPWTYSDDDPNQPQTTQTHLPNNAPQSPPAKL